MIGLIKQTNKSFRLRQQFKLGIKKSNYSHNLIPQEINSMEIIATEFQKRQKQLVQKHSIIQKQIDAKINLPLKLSGVKNQSEEKYSYLPDRVMSYYRIHPTTITNYLLKMYKASLYAIVDCNQDFMRQYWEEQLMQRVIKGMKQAKDKNYTVLVEQASDLLQEITDSCQMVDSVMIRGLSVNRKDNQEEKFYKKFSQHQEVGLITYTPLYLTEINEHFIDPKLNKKVYDGYQKMILRVLVRIKIPLYLHVYEFKIPADVNTYEHMIIYENQMIAPKHLESKYKLQTLMEWLGKYKFGKWKIVDMDNYMLGNCLFQKKKIEEEVDEVLENTIYDPKCHINIRNI